MAEVAAAGVGSAGTRCHIALFMADGETPLFGLAFRTFLGCLIWSQSPISGMLALGVLVGVNLLGTGLALVTIASCMVLSAPG